MKIIEASRVKLGNVLAKDPSKKDVILDRKDVKVEDPSKEKNPSKKKVVTKPSKYDYPKIKSDNGKEREMTSNEKKKYRAEMRKQSEEPKGKSKKEEKVDKKSKVKDEKKSSKKDKADKK